ncbi:hypothetical protein NPIL_125041 [Nephila pilipes]|uniref:Uncharacterized protein n=1 Tax=Nephila pilipes TaxID=299642 RepID=A0A8X6P0K3_NEPPI|nr:hypothetical protein NPIL_125041 [Nephila pilipes]
MTGKDTETLKLKDESKQKKAIPVVRSVTVYKICQGSGLDVELKQGKELTSKPENKTRTVIPVIQSLTIFKFCDALNIKVTLADPPFKLK